MNVFSGNIFGEGRQYLYEGTPFTRLGEDAAGTFINRVLCTYPGDAATALSMTVLVIFWKIEDLCIEMKVSLAAFLIFFFISAIYSSHKLHVQTPSAVSSWVGFCERRQGEEQVDMQVQGQDGKRR